MKKPFLEQPQAWTESSRMSQHPSEYANAFEPHAGTNEGTVSKALTALAATIVVASVLMLCIVYFSKGVS
jgi:hypothetical protein